MFVEIYQAAPCLHAIQFHCLFSAKKKKIIEKKIKYFFYHAFSEGLDVQNFRTFSVNTLMCLSIRSYKAINFPFVSNEKLMFFRCPNIQAHYNEAVIYLNFGTPKNNEFSIWNKWKINYF